MSDATIRARIHNGLSQLKEHTSHISKNSLVLLQILNYLTMVNQKNKQTFSPPRVGEVSNLAGAECTINSKVYHK